MPDLAALLAPRSVAIVGAAPKGQGLRGRIIEIMRMHPYAGAVYPVSRSHDEVQGLRAYRAVADIPASVDLAVLIIPAEHVLAELERCGQAGVKAAAVISSGFAEEEGGAGATNQAQLARIARTYDMAVLGPNSEGFANLPLDLCPTFSPAVAETSVPLGHKDAAYVRSHFDAMEVRLVDAPRAGEILVAIVVTDSGRPLPRIGGLTTAEIKGADGLR